jgi:predicted nucleic acid-binding protein
LIEFVLDCSITMAWFFKDESDSYSSNILEQLTNSQAWVPTIWSLEVANAFLSAESRKRISAADVAQAIAQIRSLPIKREEINADSATLIDIGRRYHLSVYDATYLDLAMRLGLDLASKDSKLVSAARKCGITLLNRQ